MNEGDVPRLISGTVLLTTALLVASGASAGAASVQVHPGTATRPVLSAAEAASLSPHAYLAHHGQISAPTLDPWTPGPVRRPRGSGEFVVPGAYSTVQQAVNAAARRGGTERAYIELRPGTYTGTVYVPASAPPITLYGSGSRPDKVSIEFSLDATASPADYAARVNPAGQYVAGDPAWEMYSSCASRPSATIASCATVLWSQNRDFQLTNLTVRNTLLDTVDGGTHQALAVRTEGDRTHLESVRLIGRQDTAYFNTVDAATIARVFARDSYFEGDTDFVYGRATAVLERCRFVVVSSRKPANGVIFAPSTAPNWPYGFLVLDARISADEGYHTAPTAHLGRAWDAGAGGTGYLPGISPNGQLLIRNSQVGAGFDLVAPWAPAATTGRPFVTSISPNRTLDDPAYNRLWEFDNHWPELGAR
jgi:pectinesterase